LKIFQGAGSYTSFVWNYRFFSDTCSIFAKGQYANFWRLKSISFEICRKNEIGYYFWTNTFYFWNSRAEICLYVSQNLFLNRKKLLKFFLSVNTLCIFILAILILLSSIKAIWFSYFSRCLVTRGGPNICVCQIPHQIPIIDLTVKPIVDTNGFSLSYAEIKSPVLAKTGQKTEIPNSATISDKYHVNSKILKIKCGICKPR
jgi:hypothetical protein